MLTIRDTYHAYIKRDVTLHSSSGNKTIEGEMKVR